jgi:hypothetical protein
VLKYTNKLKLLENRFRRHIREEVRDVIYTQLVAFENQSKEKPMFAKKVKRVGHGQLFLVYVC